MNLCCEEAHGGEIGFRAKLRKPELYQSAVERSALVR